MFLSCGVAVVYLSAYKDAKLPPAKVTVKAVKPTDKPDTVTVRHTQEVQTRHINHMNR